VRPARLYGPVVHRSMRWPAPIARDLLRRVAGGRGERPIRTPAPRRRLARLSQARAAWLTGLERRPKTVPLRPLT
jgi:hypothetical protein